MMKKIPVLAIAVLIHFNCLNAQNNDVITVRAGSRIIDNFPFGVRYLYQEFTAGRVVFNNGIYSERLLNYNFLPGEVEFIQSKDTLSILNKKDIKYVSIAQDTFFYDRGYIRLLTGGIVMSGEKQYFNLTEVKSTDSYGTSTSGGASTSYNSLPADGNFYKLNANKDMVLRKTTEFYLGDPSGGFILFRKKNVLQRFPEKADEIKRFIKSNKTNFNSREDFFKMAEFLGNIKQ